MAGAGNREVLDRQNQTGLERHRRLERLHSGAIEEGTIGVTRAEQFSTGGIDGDNSHVVT